jgi:hypothetical protein
MQCGRRDRWNLVAPCPPVSLWPAQPRQSPAASRRKSAREEARPPAGAAPKSDRLAPRFLALLVGGRTCQLIGRQPGLSKNTVADVVRRGRAAEGDRVEPT